MIKVALFGLEDWEKQYYEKLGSFRELAVTPIFVDDILTAEKLPSPEAAEAEIVSVFVDSEINLPVLEALPRLKYLITRSTGFDHIDLAACAARGVTVSTVPDYGEITVAEYAFALMLTLSRKIYTGFDRIRETGTFSPEGLKGFDLYGKTLGIIGTGRIGKHAAGIGRGFGMTVVAHDIYPNDEAAAQIGFKYVRLEELLKTADIVSLHVPYSPENHHLLDGEKLALMKPSALLINTARGALVDTPALVKALKDGAIAGAGLDVLEEEGVIKDEFGYLARPGQHPVDLKAVIANHVLFDLPNVVITPHNAFNTQEALERILNTTVKNIKAYLIGAPINLVSAKK